MLTGGGFVREQAVRFLDREVTPLLRNGSFGGRAGVELLRASAELTQLVGWMSYDGTARPVPEVLHPGTSSGQGHRR